MRWLLPTLITLPLIKGVWDTTPTEARGGCPSVYIYDLPQLWDVRVPLDELRNVSGKFVFGRPCDGGIPEEFDTDQCEIPKQCQRPIMPLPPGTPCRSSCSGACCGRGAARAR